MHINKGYIAPVILILLLLSLATVLVFTQKTAESPIVEKTPILREDIKKSTSTSDIKIDNEYVGIKEDNSTTTNSTTTETEQNINSTSTNILNNEE